ncbi:hypothetical protein ACTFIR_004386 [Dictyostelium discoideum]
MVDTTNLIPNTPRYLKVPLIAFNTILWVLGLVLVIIGSMGVSFFSNFKDFTKVSKASAALSNLTTGAPAGVLVIGIFFVILTVVGCFVAGKEKLVGLVIYTMLMLILLVALIGVGGKALTLHNDDVVKQIGNAWEDVSNGPKNSTILKMENFLKCCYWNSTSTRNPLLCPKDSKGIPKYTDTCDSVISSKISSNLYLVGAAAVSIGVIEFICMLFALFLIIRICRAPRTKSYDYQ